MYLWPIRLPALLLALSGAAQAFGQGATATLVNRTGQVWRVQADPMLPPRIRVRLTVAAPGPAAPAAPLDVPGTGVAAVDLPPGATLTIAHFEPPGGDVRRFFELRTEPGPDHAGPWPVEGCLFLRTAPAWVLWGPDRTVLAGWLYADGTVPPFRFAPQGDGVLHLERAPGPGPATGCLISWRTCPRPCRSPWPEPGRRPGPPGAAG
jgi:hypothetical protein